MTSLPIGISSSSELSTTSVPAIPTTPTPTSTTIPLTSSSISASATATSTGTTSASTTATSSTTPTSTTASSMALSTASTTTPTTSPSSTTIPATAPEATPTASTVITVISSTPTSSTSAVAAQRDTGFFHNTGAVAGTFSAVGVVVVVILIFLATAYIRRRRERKFDDETDEAAAAAAAAASTNPDFLRDDYDYRSNNTNFGAYSETSHGTLGQPPLTHPETFSSTYAPEPYNAAGAGVAGAAGVGAGIAGVGRARSQRSGAGHEPYNAFAVPHDAPPVPETYEMADANQLRYRRSTGPYQYDPIIGGYGTGDDPYAIARGPSQRKPTLSRNASGSMNAMSAEQGHVVYNQPGQIFHPPMPQSEPQQAQYVSNGAALSPYGGIRQDESAELPNPYSADASKSHLVEPPYPEEDGDGGRPSYVVDDDHSHKEAQSDSEDDDEPEHNPRVLRVANE